MRALFATLTLTALGATSAGAQAGGRPAVHCNFALVLTWTAETSGYETRSRVVTETRYEVLPADRAQLAGLRDGAVVLLRLRYLSGRSIAASGASNGVASDFVDRTPRAPEREPGSAAWAEDGTIRGTGRDTVVIEPRVRPDIETRNAAAEEASGCWGEWPELEISYSKLRDLHLLRRTFTASAVREEAPGCRGEMRVEVAAVMTATLPDPDDPMVSLADCTGHGGAVSLDGLWCLGGDYACYRIGAPPPTGRPRRPPGGA